MGAEATPPGFSNCRSFDAVWSRPTGSPGAAGGCPGWLPFSHISHILCSSCSWAGQFCPSPGESSMWKKTWSNPWSQLPTLCDCRGSSRTSPAWPSSGDVLSSLFLTGTNPALWKVTLLMFCQVGNISLFAVKAVLKGEKLLVTTTRGRGCSFSLSFPCRDVSLLLQLLSKGSRIEIWICWSGWGKIKTWIWKKCCIYLSSFKLCHKVSPSRGWISTSFMHNITHSPDSSVIFRMVNKQFILLCWYWNMK